MDADEADKARARNSQQHREQRANPCEALAGLCGSPTPSNIESNGQIKARLRKAANSSRRQYALALRRSTFGIARYVDQSPLEELTLGNIDKACTDCEVKHFTEEQTNSGSACSMCCIAESFFDYEGHKRNGDANYNILNDEQKNSY